MTDGWGSSVGGGWDPIGGSGDDVIFGRDMYLYVHVNNIFINPDIPDVRYFCESASSDSVSTVISEIVSPVDGEQYYYIDDFTKEEETGTYVSVDWSLASEGIITSVSDIDNFYDFDKHYTRAIPSLPSTPDTPDTPSDNPSTPDIPDEPIDGLSISEIDINGITYSIKDKSIYTKEEVNVIFNLVREKLGLEPFDYSDSGSGDVTLEAENNTSTTPSDEDENNNYISQIKVLDDTYSIRDKNVYTKKEVQSIINALMQELEFDPIDFGNN